MRNGVDIQGDCVHSCNVTYFMLICIYAPGITISAGPTSPSYYRSSYSRSGVMYIIKQYVESHAGNR